MQQNMFSSNSLIGLVGFIFLMAYQLMYSAVCKICQISNAAKYVFKQLINWFGLVYLLDGISITYGLLDARI